MGHISSFTEDDKRRRLAGTLQDGETIGFELAFMDSVGPGRVFHADKQPDAPKSIDEAVRIEIESAAKSQNQKPSEWLAENAGKPLTALIQHVAEKFVAAAGGAGVTAAFSLDRCAMAVIRDVALADASTSLRTSVGDAAVAQAVYDTRASMAKNDMRNGWRRPATPAQK